MSLIEPFETKTCWDSELCTQPESNGFLCIIRLSRATARRCTPCALVFWLAFDRALTEKTTPTEANGRARRAKARLFNINLVPRLLNMTPALLRRAPSPSRTGSPRSIRPQFLWIADARRVQLETLSTQPESNGMVATAGTVSILLDALQMHAAPDFQGSLSYCAYPHYVSSLICIHARHDGLWPPLKTQKGAEMFVEAPNPIRTGDAHRVRLGAFKSLDGSPFGQMNHRGNTQQVRMRQRFSDPRDCSGLNKRDQSIGKGACPELNRESPGT
ncbi:hypothetical protein C8R46DRAFT_1026842 [Mycena filopes]|nr:hypothetical protein C8R46DRAFT_1026842 [Mycena filopes]